MRYPPPISRQQQQQPCAHISASSALSGHIFSQTCQRRFLARTTHQRLKTTAPTRGGESRKQAAIGYVPPHLVRHFKKAKKYISGYSSSSAKRLDQEQIFDPRPSGRISDERDILCSALRQIGARQVFYGPNVHIVDTPKKCSDALILIQEYYDTLRGGIGAVGFDTETTVYRTWNSSTNDRTSILQIATEDVCLIIQLYYMTREGKDKLRIPDKLKQFLQDPDQLKVGVSITRDAAELDRGYGLQINGLVELSDLAASKGATSLSSLEDLDNMFGADEWSVVKTDDIYRWDFDGQILHRNAIWYSAVDALACKAIYENLQQGKRKSTYIPWEERFPMTPEEEYRDVMKFLRFKIKPERVYPVDSIKILLTKSYPRFRRIHSADKLNVVADDYITKLLKDGVLMIDEKHATEQELTLQPEQITAASHPGLVLKFLYKKNRNNDQPLVVNSPTQSTNTDDSSTISLDAVTPSITAAEVDIPSAHQSWQYSPQSRIAAE